MKLAFSGYGRYPDFTAGYKLYRSRRRGKKEMTEKEYSKVIREYCKILANDLIEYGMVDLPAQLGTLSTVMLTRRPRYMGKQFIGFGKKDWSTGHFDGNLKAFGIAFLPRRTKTNNLRCYGFVANRKLFSAVKKRFLEEECTWSPLDYKDEMI